MVSSIAGPLMSLYRTAATASLALRCCGGSISEPSLSLAARREQHQRAIVAARSSNMGDLSGCAGRAPAAGGLTAGPSPCQAPSWSVTDLIREPRASVLTRGR